MTAGNRPAVPPARHPDLDTLADLDAGLLDAPAAERLTAHVAGCADCTRAVAALGAVRADLAALPAPPLPDAVAARLDATLAGLRRDDDRLARAGSAAAGGVPDTSPHPPGSGSARPAAERGSGDAADLDAARQRRRQRSLRRAGGAVAAAFALLAAGASVTALVRTVDTGADSAGGAAAPRSSPGRTRRRRPARTLPRAARAPPRRRGTPASRRTPARPSAATWPPSSGTPRSAPAPAEPRAGRPGRWRTPTAAGPASEASSAARGCCGPSSGSGTTGSRRTPSSSTTAPPDARTWSATSAAPAGCRRCSTGCPDPGTPVPAGPTHPGAAPDPGGRSRWLVLVISGLTQRARRGGTPAAWHSEPRPDTADREQGARRIRSSAGGAEPAAVPVCEGRVHL